ncbi:MAG: hypothetical protein RJB38_684 [Pseudomonadota bacterium]|jgi:uncharacterized protein YbjT (DUF2867 family)
MRIAIAGASGFVGMHLIRHLGQSEHRVIALSRSRIADLPENAEWREADLFSQGSTQRALAGVDVAIYLVHSMLPSTSLFQGSFHDTDLLLADNFARACATHGVQQILYLGGLLPEGHISPHLESRLEVEGVLKTAGIPVTIFRAGMIVGPGGSSFEILHTLVDRLPAMILPSWTQKSTQVIFIDDVVRVLAIAVGDPRFSNRTINLVNGEALRYEDLLRQMARVLGVRRWMIPVPIRSTGFSKLWVTFFGKSNYELVSPLVDSLLCDLPSAPPDEGIAPIIQWRSFEAMALESLRRSPQVIFRKRPAGRIRQKTVRSIQRLPRVQRADSRWIATEYLRWLPRLFRSFIQVRSHEDSGTISFHAFGISHPLLELRLIQDRDEPSRMKFHITGGVLSATSHTGWLEFRQVQAGKYTLSAIHEFVPSLPWVIYRCTQAPLHAWVMRQFAEHLSHQQIHQKEGMLGEKDS